MARRTKRPDYLASVHEEVRAIARKLNVKNPEDPTEKGTEEGLILLGGRAIKVNGTREVVVALVEDVPHEASRLPAHAVGSLQALVNRVFDRAQRVVVKMEGCPRRAGWKQGPVIVYYDPAPAG